MQADKTPKLAAQRVPTRFVSFWPPPSPRRRQRGRLGAPEKKSPAHRPSHSYPPVLDVHRLGASDARSSDSVSAYALRNSFAFPVDARARRAVTRVWTSQ